MRARTRHQTSRSAPETHVPFVLVETGTHGLRVVCANRAAQAEGVSGGLRFTDAKARCPSLVSEDIDRAGDARALADLGHWMIRFSPHVAVDGLDGLMIETTGCAHLYGGEPAMLERVDALMRRHDIPARMGLASTPGAASALARAKPGTCLELGSEMVGLRDLPVSALRLSEAAQLLLRRFGLSRIGQLYGIDRGSLARRFRSSEMADAVLLRLDQALGRRAEPLSPLRPVPAHAVRLPCPEPIGTSEAIELGLERLAHTLCDDLANRGEGARGFTLLAFRSDGEVSGTEITLARPGRSATHVLRLFREKIDRIDPGFGIDCLVLEAHRTGPMETGATALSGDLAPSDTDPVMLAALADRITAKLGEGSVCVTRVSQSHVPERADRLGAFDGALPEPQSEPTFSGLRPIRLLSSPEPIEVLAEVPDGPPQRFVWRRVVRRVMRADGPERISPEWWRHTRAPDSAASPQGTDRKWLAPKLDRRADAGLIDTIRAELETAQDAVANAVLQRARDYYRIEDETGRRYWVFRKGLYGDGRGGPPEWYVHGLFA